MVNNLPIKKIVHQSMTIEGWSRAAVQTYWRIPELKIGFDLGAQPWDFMGTQKWYISHTHLDHVAALPVYVARRRMMKLRSLQFFDYLARKSLPIHESWQTAVLQGSRLLSFLWPAVKRKRHDVGCFVAVTDIDE